MQQSVLSRNWAEPVVVTSGGDFLRPRRGSESSQIPEEFRETCLVTCDFLVISIDSEAIYSHLSPRLLAALRGRRRRLMLMLTLEQRLGAAMTRCRVEGVLGFLGCCAAVQSVEIRLIMDEHMAEEPTYEQLPVGAWLAERVMSNFPNCKVLGFKPFLMQHSELLELLTHPLVVGRIQHVDIQTALLTGRERAVPFPWVEPALGLTSLHATYLGPLPISLRDRTSNLVKLSVTEMFLPDVANLPQSVSTLLIGDLIVYLPEPDMAAVSTGVADLSSGRFGRLSIGVLAMAITSRAGCSAVAALKPLVGRFREAMVQRQSLPDNLIPTLAVHFIRAGAGRVFSRLSKKCWEACFLYCDTFSLDITSEIITTHLSPDVLALLRGRQKPLWLRLQIHSPLGAARHRCRVDWVIGLLGRCEAVQMVSIGFGPKTAEVQPWWKRHYEQLPIGDWLGERLMANFPKCHLLTFPGFFFRSAQLEAFMRHSLIAERITHLNIFTGGHDGSFKDNWRAFEDIALKLTSLWTIERLEAVLPEPDLMSLARGVQALSTGSFEKLRIGVLGLSFTCKEGASQASLSPLMPLVGQFEKAIVEVDGLRTQGPDRIEAAICHLPPLLAGCAEVTFIGCTRPLYCWSEILFMRSLAPGGLVSYHSESPR
ncbi:hypothetical protein V8C86DRAFT_3112119 [Haematococcus lacustris]